MENQKIKIKWKNYKNGFELKKIFDHAFADLLDKQLLFQWDQPTIELLLKQFDGLVSIAKEKIAFEQEDRNLLIDDLIKIKQEAIKESNALEVQTVATVKFRQDLEEEIAALKINKKYSSINVDRKCLITWNTFERFFTSKIDACERLLRSSALMPTTKIKLMQVAGIQNGGESLEEMLRKQISQDDEFTFKKCS